MLSHHIDKNLFLIDLWLCRHWSSWTLWNSILSGLKIATLIWQYLNIDWELFLMIIKSNQECLRRIEEVCSLNTRQRAKVEEPGVWLLSNQNVYTTSVMRFFNNLPPSISSLSLKQFETAVGLIANRWTQRPCYMVGEWWDDDFLTPSSNQFKWRKSWVNSSTNNTTSKKL